VALTYSYNNPLQKNQYVMRTTEEIQEIINDPKYEGWTKKDFRGEGKLNNIKEGGVKILTRKETERATLTFPFTGKRRFKDPNLANIIRDKKIKETQGSNISIKGSGQTGTQFSHVYPLIKSAKPGTKTTFKIPAQMNRKLEGFNITGQNIAEEQEELIKNKPDGYKKKIVELNAKAKLNVNNAINTLGKDYKGQIGYFEVNPETGEFKPKAGNYKMSFAGLEGKNEIFKDMTGKERKDFERKISALENAKKIEGVTTANKAPIPEKSKMLNMFKNFGKAKTAIPAAIFGGAMASGMGGEAEAAITYNPTIGALVKTGSDDIASQSNVLEWAAKNPEASMAGTATAGLGMTKPGSAVLKGLLKTLAAPAVGAGYAALDVKENLDEGESLPEALADKSAGVSLMGSRALGGGLGTLLGGAKIARSFTPIGAAMTAAGIGKDYYDWASDEIDRLEAMDPDERAAYNEMMMDETNIDF